MTPDQIKEHETSSGSSMQNPRRKLQKELAELLCTTG